MRMISHRKFPASAALSLLIALLAVASVRADEIKVVTSGGFTAAYLELVPEYEGSTHNKLVTERAALDAPLNALRQAANSANAVVPQRQNELNNATAAKAAADKVVAEKAPNAQALAAKVQAAKEEAEALAVEKKTADTAKAATPAATASKS